MAQVKNIKRILHALHPHASKVYDWFFSNEYKWRVIETKIIYLHIIQMHQKTKDDASKTTQSEHD